jgi:hypothetical protein
MMLCHIDSVIVSLCHACMCMCYVPCYVLHSCTHYAMYYVCIHIVVLCTYHIHLYQLGIVARVLGSVHGECEGKCTCEVRS